MRRAVAAAAFAVALALGTISPALGEKPGPWTPVHTDPFQAPAGTRCPFSMGGEVLRDHERMRTLETYPDGSPKVQQIVGPLVMRFTHLETGESIKRNLTGNGIIEYGTEGSFTLTLRGGHFAAGLAPTDVGGPAFLVFTGSGHSVRFNPDGSRTVTYGHGPVKNICDTLA